MRSYDYRQRSGGLPFTAGHPSHEGLAAFLCSVLVIILYVDESGDPDDLTQPFVLGGVAVPERWLGRIQQALDRLVLRHLDPKFADIELHASNIRTGRGPWGRIPRSVREEILTDLATYLGAISQTDGYALFGVVADAGDFGTDRLERSYEELLLRFTQMLIRRRSTIGPQVGIVVGDEAKYERYVQPLVQKWRVGGTRVSRLTRLGEVPLFTDSHSTRLVQAADFVAHAIYRHYTAAQDDLFGPLLPRFDTSNGVIHGLFHLASRRTRTTCPCPACVSRVTAQRRPRVQPSN
jgi:hypothetical protein